MKKGAFTVSDLSLGSVRETEYDFGVFCSGYESRCTFVAESVGTSRCHAVAVGMFSQHANLAARRQADNFFRTIKNAVFFEEGAKSEFAIAELLGRLPAGNAPLKILVDYSSMPRRWFTMPLLWALYQQKRPIELHFTYSLGEHQEVFQPNEIEDILCLPGCEGRQTAARKSIAVFGFGFEGVCLETAYNMLEVDLLHAFVCSPGTYPGYDERAIRANESLVNELLHKKVWQLPLRSVEETYRFLLEFATDAVRHSNVCFLPAGPKPGVLACILAALRTPSVSCLHLKFKRSEPRQVGASGEVVATRVMFY